MLLLVLLAHVVFAEFRVLKFEDSLQSRGMMLYYTGWVVLLAMPLLNRYLKIVALYPLSFLLARGFMRITDEQDPVRAVYSMLPGIDVGIKVALPLVTVALVWKAFSLAFRHGGWSRGGPSEEEEREFLALATRREWGEKELRDHVLAGGFSEGDAERVIARFRERGDGNPLTAK